MRAPLARLFPFAAELSDVGGRELAALVPREAPPLAALLRRGDAAGGAYLVLRGELRVYYVTPRGREATLYRVEPGGTCVLALGATLDDSPYPAWVDAGARGATFVRIPSARFHALLDRERAFRGFVLRAMSGRLFELMTALEELGSVEVEQRVARYLTRRAAGPTRAVSITQAALAADLGTAREVISRTLRALAARGLVGTSRGRVRVTDPAGLARVAGADPPEGPPSVRSSTRRAGVAPR